MNPTRTHAIHLSLLTNKDTSLTLPLAALITKHRVPERSRRADHYTLTTDDSPSQPLI
jgi:hypothetical protein